MSTNNYQKNENLVGTWRFGTRVPFLITLPVEDQIELLFEHGYLAECNDITAQMYGMERGEQLRGVYFRSIFPRNETNLAYIQAWIQSSYILKDIESQEKDKDGNTKYFLNSLTGIIENDYLIGAEGSQIDITVTKDSNK